MKDLTVKTAREMRVLIVFTKAYINCLLERYKPNNSEEAIQEIIIRSIKEHYPLVYPFEKSDIDSSFLHEYEELDTKINYKDTIYKVVIVQLFVNAKQACNSPKESLYKVGVTKLS